MKRKEIETRKAQLSEILRQSDDGTRIEKVKTWAREVDASITRIVNVQVGHDASNVYYKPYNVITESEIVHNIQAALQTETMIDMSKTVARNWIIAVIASAVGFLSMVAAWVAAMAAWAR